MPCKKYDVVAVSLDTNKITIMAEGKTEAAADYIETQCVLNHGVVSCFYAIVPAGEYKEGDEWNYEVEEGVDVDD